MRECLDGQIGLAAFVWGAEWVTTKARNGMFVCDVGSGALVFAPIGKTRTEKDPSDYACVGLHGRCKGGVPGGLSNNTTKL